jgi:hypothetical protein
MLDQRHTHKHAIVGSITPKYHTATVPYEMVQSAAIK